MTDNNKNDQKELNRSDRESVEESPNPSPPDLRGPYNVDSLTGLHSIHYFFELGEKEIRQAEKSGHPLCFLYADLDHFIVINYNHGHESGDRVLVRFAEICREIIGDAIIIGRLGGDEFGALLPGVDLDTACILGEKLRLALAGQTFYFNQASYTITVSIGVTALEPGDTMQTAMLRADKTLFMAKSYGANRVLSSADLDPSLFKR